MYNLAVSCRCSQLFAVSGDRSLNTLAGDLKHCAKTTLQVETNMGDKIFEMHISTYVLEPK